MGEVSFVKPKIEAELPLTPIGWRVIIRPYEPPTESAGGIIFDATSMESEEYLTYVGQIVAMGNLCFKAVTRSGIDLSEVDPLPKVGDWVMFGTYGGQKVHMKNGVKYLSMNDDGIMAIVKDPAQFRAHI
jgi:co-chaperonin GroES (HSP10)